MSIIACIGETLWDTYPGRKYLGGAPLNAAVHLASLGDTPLMISAVGRDGPGRAALAHLDELGVDCRFMTTNDRPTGQAIVYPEKEGDERFDLPEDVAYDKTELSGSGLTSLCRMAPKALIYGSLAQKRSATVRSSVRNILRAIPGCEGFYDANLRKQYYDEELVAESIDECGIFKLNVDEVDMLSYLLFDEVMDPDRFARFVFSDFACHTVIVTCGGDGAAAYGRDGTIVRAYPIPVTVVDTVGCGDAFSAGYLSAWLRTGDMAKAVCAGNEFGAKTATHAGAF